MSTSRLPPIGCHCMSLEADTPPPTRRHRRQVEVQISPHHQPPRHTVGGPEPTKVSPGGGIGEPCATVAWRASGRAATAAGAGGRGLWHGCRESEHHSRLVTTWSRTQVLRLRCICVWHCSVFRGISAHKLLARGGLWACSLWLCLAC